MPLPTVEQALDNLEHAQARGHITVDLQVRVSTLAAAVQFETARVISEAQRQAAETTRQASDADPDPIRWTG
jgi:hypothetical protein